VDAYAGSTLGVQGFGAAFNFGEPAVLTQNWTSVNVALATAAGLGLLAVWVAIAALLPAGARAVTLLAGLTVVSVVADVQMTDRIGTSNQQLAREAEVTPVAGLRHGEQIGISTALGWQLWTPQMDEIPWSAEVFFNPVTEPPPTGVTVVEVPWIAGQSEKATWPNAPQGWHITSASQAAGWVVWQAPATAG
jgi:hypothetical protein